MAASVGKVDTVPCETLKEEQTIAENGGKPKLRNKLFSTVRKAWVAEGKDPAIFAPSWNEFTQTTTFHGVKYIFDSGDLRFRRVLWVLCVVAAITTFVIQVGMRAGDYFRYHTTVDVQVVYADSLPFPAVTVCNMNNFRLTKTDEKGLYDFIDYAYGIKNVSGLNFTGFDFEGVDVEEFIREAAHQKDDLIDSCSWKGSEHGCNTADNFTLTHTDMGVCYTFNAGGQNRLLVSDPGAGHALSMIINVEQYEYSRGPHNDAGIKILLHDPSEFPMILDLGFAVAPGTHTLVGVQSTEVVSMKEPYGTCEAGRNVSMTDCVLKCRTGEVIDRCGCRAVYMPQIHGNQSIPVCDMEANFGCARLALGSMTRTSKCKCSEPCVRRHFEPALSYALLSEFNIDRTVLRDSRREYVSGKLVKAKDTYERVDRQKFEHDATQLKYISGNLTRLEADVTTAVRLHQDVASFLAEILLALDADLKKLLAFWDFTNVSMTTLLGKLDTMVVNVTGIAAIFKWSTLHELVTCKASLSFSHYTKYQTCTGNDCDDVFCRYLNDVMRIVPTALALRDTTEAFQHDYLQLISSIFDGSFKAPDNIPEHVQCLSQIRGMFSGEYGADVATLSSLLNQTLVAESTDQLYNLTSYISTLLNGSTLQNTSMLGTVRAHCNWFPKYAVPKSQLTSEWSRCWHTVEHTRENTVTLLDDLPVLHRALADINTFLLPIIERYLDQDLAKLELHRLFQVVPKMVDRLEAPSGELKTTHKLFKTSLDLVGDRIADAYASLYNDHVPLLNDNHGQLDIMDLLAESDALGNVTDADAAAFALSQIIRTSVRLQLGESVDQIHTALGNNRLYALISAYQDTLNSYAQHCIVNEQFFARNFMQVDIFYKEMKYERIQQRPAFQAISLLSEVGGFLGLLLGASVLTVCELVDHLVMTFLTSVRKKNDVSPQGAPSDNV